MTTPEYRFLIKSIRFQISETSARIDQFQIEIIYNMDTRFRISEARARIDQFQMQMPYKIEQIPDFRVQGQN